MRNFRSPFLIIFTGCLISIGCAKEDHFGKSAFKKILYFTLPGQVGNSVIDQENLTIKISVSAQADLKKLYPDSIRLSTFATINPGVNVVQDFSKPVTYAVSAEDGSMAVYQVQVSKQAENPQISNSGFEEWYTPAGKNYQQPGLDNNSAWATGNAGVVTLGSANTTPVEISSGDLAAQMLTKDLGVLGQIAGQRMAAATLFTGTFVLDISNPLNSTKFGIAFAARPKSFSVDYSYSAGSPYKNGTGQTLNKKDSCDIYLLLENRSGITVKRIATAWFRSGEESNHFKNINIPITYGVLPSGAPAYQLPVNGQFGAATDPVTHITVVFSSSAYGNSFEGGVDSKLVVNNLHLNY